MRLGKAEWHSRCISLLLPLLMATGLQAEGDGWNDFLATWRKADHSPATLLIPKDGWRASYPRSDEALLLLDATGDMKIQSIEGPSLAGLREARNWKDGSHWILLARDGAVLDEGTDLPKGDYLQSRLAGAGIPSTWEALDAFIRLHPDNGSAIQRRLYIATGLARRRLWNFRDQGKVQGARLLSDSLLPGMEPAKLVDQALPDEWCKEVEDSLGLLNQLPDPWRMGDRFLFQFWLELYGKVGSSGLRMELLKLMDAVQEAWSRSPHSGRNPMQTAQTEGGPFGLGTFWMACESASRPSSALPELPSLTPSPGRFWPDSGVMNLFWTRPGRVPGQELMVFLDRIPPMDWESVPWNESWSDWVGFRSYLFYLRGMSLANLGRWQEAISALQEFRRLSGKHWAESAPQMLAWFSPPTSPEPGKSTTSVKPSVPDDVSPSATTTTLGRSPTPTTSGPAPFPRVGPTGMGRSVGDPACLSTPRTLGTERTAASSSQRFGHGEIEAGRVPRHRLGRVPWRRHHRGPGRGQAEYESPGRAAAECGAFADPLV